MQNWFKHILKLLAVFIALFSHQSLAQTGAWQSEEGGRIRVSFDANPRNAAPSEAYGLIEVELKQGWKTYWKDPGSSGMAPELDLFYSEGNFNETKLTSELLFPKPSIFPEKTGKGVIFGYKNMLQLPFRLIVPAKTGEIVGTLWIGLCDDVCMLTEVSFAFDVEEKADFLTKGRIEAALAALPQ